MELVKPVACRLVSAPAFISVPPAATAIPSVPILVITLLISSHVSLAPSKMLRICIIWFASSICFFGS